jgi:hypothetical protein
MSYLEKGDLSLFDNINEQNAYLKEEYGPDIIIARSTITPTIVKIFKPSGIGQPKPYQIAEGEFKVVTFQNRLGMIVHEVTFLESGEFLAASESKAENRSFWDKFKFWNW